MQKIKIKMVTLGHQPLGFQPHRLLDFRSSIFRIESIENCNFTVQSDIEGWGFSDNLLSRCIPKKLSEDILFVVANVPLELNYYSRRIGINKIIFTFHEIKDILEQKNIPLNNAVLRILNTYSLVFKKLGKVPSNFSLSQFAHDETRGCIFDMNGIKAEIVESCQRPIICPQCVHDLTMDGQVSNDVINKCKKDIDKIRKTKFYEVTDFIKGHPYISLTLTSIYAIILGVIGSIIASFIWAGLFPF